MFILDLFEGDIGITPLPKGYHDEKEDQTVLKLSDMRKTRLSLSQIHRIRILNDIKKLEQAKKLDRLHVQYSAPAQDGMM